MVFSIRSFSLVGRGEGGSGNLGKKGQRHEQPAISWTSNDQFS